MGGTYGAAGTLGRLPNLLSSFVGYSAIPGTTGGTADAVVPEHNHSATFSGSNSISSLNNFNLYGSGSGTAVATGNSAAVTGSVSVENAGVSGVDQNLPPYVGMLPVIKY